MEVVKLFNSELSSLYETKPPISKAKMTSITRTAIKAIKFYKHVVQSVEKFIQKCKPEYKVPGLYVIDSIVRQSRHQFGTEKDVFAPRFARNIQQTFIHLFHCPPEDKSKVIRVLNLWQKNAVFDSEVIQPLFDLADPNHPIHKEQNATTTPSNGITTSKSTSGTVIAAKPPSGGKLGKEGTAGWLNQLNIDPSAASLQAPTSSLPIKQPPVPGQPAPGVLDMNFIQQLQQLQTLLLDQQQSDHTTPIKKEPDQVKFDKKLLDFDYGEEEEDDNNAAPAPVPSLPQQQVAAGIDSLGSILSNPEVLRHLQNLQQQLNQQQIRQQQLELEEKVRRLQQMQQQEEEFDKHLAQTIPNLPFADECDLKPGSDLNSSVSLHQALVAQAQALAFPGVDLNQPPPNYLTQMKPPATSPLEDGERVNSDVDERTGRTKDNSEGGGAVVIIDSESPSESPARSHRRRRRSRSRSRSRRRSRSDSRSRSRSKRKRSRSNDRDNEKDWERSKQREVEREKERERRRKGLPPVKKTHLAVCSTTLWIGHLSKLVQQEELSDTFGEYGDIVSIDLIPPRGCAFICMNRRQDAHKALQHLKHHKLQGKAITLAWAPGKGMKGKEWKDYWEVDQGVSYIPWSKLTPDCDLELLEEGGMLDEETLPEWLKERQRKSREEQQQSVQPDDGEDSQSSKPPPTTELDIPVPAPTLPGYIPLPDGPQPTDIKSTQAPTMPHMMAPAPAPMPPLGMMPPFGLPNVPRLLGPMGMPMGPGMMPNIPLGVPPPGLMGNPLIHQQMMARMPQPVGSPFSAPPGVSLMGGPHPPLSQIPLPGPGSSSQDKNKPTLPPLGVPPPSGDPSALTGFGDSMLQLPFTLPPQLQLQGLNVLGRPPILEQQSSPSTTTSTTITTTSSNTSDIPRESKDKTTEISTPTKGLNESVLTSMVNSQFLRPPPHFSPMTLMQIPPPMTILPPLVKTENRSANENSDNKSDRGSNKDKDYRPNLKDFRENDKDYRSKDREHDYRDKDYRDKCEKDYKDRDYRDRRDSRRDRNSRERAGDDKMNEDSRLDKETDDRKDFDSKKHDDGSRIDSKDDRVYRDRSRNRDRDRDRDRDRGRERSNRWSNRDRDDKRNRDRNKGKDGQSEDRDRGTSNLQERLRSIAHDQERPGEFGRRGRSPGDQHQHSLLGHSPMFHPPPGIGEQSENVPFHGQRSGPNIGGPPMFGPRGTPNEDFREGFPPGPHDIHNRHQDDFGPRGPTRPGREGFEHRGPRGPPPDGFDHRGPPPDGFDHRGPPPDGFDHRGPPPDGFDHRGPPPDGFDPRGPPADEINLRGPQHEGFDHRGPPPHDSFDHRGGPLGMPEKFGPHGPPEDFHPRIRFEFFPRRGMGHPDFPPRMMGRGPMGPMFPRGHIGMRGPRPGIWMEGQGGPPPQGGPGFPRGFPPEGHQSEEFFGRPPPFEESSRGRGGANNRGMRGRGFQSRQGDRRREDQDRSEVKRSRWSNASPQPQDDHNQNSVPKLESSPETAKPPTSVKNDQDVGDNREENQVAKLPKSEQPAASVEDKQSSSSEAQDIEKQSVVDNSVSDMAPVISPKSERLSSLSMFTPERRSASTEISDHSSSKEPERRSPFSGSETKSSANEPERRVSFSGSEAKSSANEPERRLSLSGPIDTPVTNPEPMEQDSLVFKEKVEKHFEPSVCESSSIEQVIANTDENKGSASSNSTENKADSSQTFEPSISSEQD